MPGTIKGRGWIIFFFGLLLGHLTGSLGAALCGLTGDPAAVPVIRSGLQPGTRAGRAADNRTGASHKP